MRIKTPYHTYENVMLTVEEYMADGSMAITVENPEDGEIAALTVCLCDPFLEKNEAYIETNNCPWAMEFIREYKLGEESGRVKQSGYCRYPAVIFDMEQLKKYVKEGSSGTE